ncbi:MAG TPA: RES family NAD+ phosphorylase [Candidatus Sulfotelmatobacter sp.]|nr:RES family NAD+ phosphorylase [Candidatus Sulfotelmatobacter sp.]
MLATIEPGTKFSRQHDKDEGAIFFSKTGRNRFDSPDGSFGVLYVGQDEYCAFIETFGQNTGIRLVTHTALERRHLSYLAIKTALTLVDLASSGSLTRIGADARLFSGSYAVAQRWSAALRALPTRPAGILYPARHDPARNACALFDLPESTFDVDDAGSLSEGGHRLLLGKVLDRYDFGLIRS